MAIFNRLANLFRRNRLQQEIDAELRAHLAMRADDNLAAGMPPGEARRDAALRFGNLSSLTERTGAADLNQFLETLWRDLVYAARQLRRSPGFATIAILTLALAIGSNIVVFGIVDGLLFQPLVPSAPGRLFNVVQKERGNDNQSYPDYLDYRNQNTTFRALAAYHVSQAALINHSVAYKTWLFEVSGNYFDLLGVQPALGRFFHSRDEHGPDSAPFIVLSDAFWRSHFASDPHVVGNVVRLNQHPFTIIGVAPPSFHGTERVLWPDFWVPMVNENQVEGFSFLEKRFNHGLWILGLLAPAVSPQRATDNLNAIAGRLSKLYPDTDEGMKARVVEPGMLGDTLGPAAHAFLSALMTLAFLVLLAACVNLAGIFAARTADRFRELAIRLSIGAGRLQILRQLLTETLLIALFGGLLGTFFALLLLRALSSWQPITGFPVHATLAPGVRLYLLAAVLTLLCGLLPTLLPARQLWRTDLTQAIKSSQSDTTAARRITLRDLLLGAQIALCALLLTSSLVAFRGMQRSLHVPLGFNPENVLLATADMHMAGHSDQEALTLQKRMLFDIARLPGIQAAGAVNAQPLGGDVSITPVYTNNSPGFRPSDIRFGAPFFSISPGYLAAAGTRLLAGRDFTWHDDSHAPQVAIVNQTFAHLLFPNTNALGQFFKIGAHASYRIVGILEPGKYQSLSEEPLPAMFFPFAQFAMSDTVLVARSNLPMPQAASALHALLTRLARDLPFTIETWPASLALALFPAEAAAISLGVMGLLAALLAVIGVFGMAAYSVSKRQKEFGIRLALGAQPPRLLRAAIGRPLVLLLAGSLSGLTLGLLASRLLGQIVYQATPRDPIVWLGVLLAMLVLGLSATWLPARRALRVNPAQLLRQDA